MASPPACHFLSHACFFLLTPFRVLFFSVCNILLVPCVLEISSVGIVRVQFFWRSSFERARDRLSPLPPESKENKTNPSLWGTEIRPTGGNRMQAAGNEKQNGTEWSRDPQTQQAITPISTLPLPPPLNLALEFPKQKHTDSLPFKLAGVGSGLSSQVGLMIYDTSLKIPGIYWNF